MDRQTLIKDKVAELQKRMDDEDSGWRTLDNDVHIHFGDDGTVDKGPKGLQGKDFSKKEKHEPKTAEDYVSYFMKKINDTDDDDDIDSIVEEASNNEVISNDDYKKIYDEALKKVKGHHSYY